jgi:integrase
MLSPRLLELLREWWLIARQQGWLFPRRNPVNPITARQLDRVIHLAAEAAEIDKRVSMHALRHYLPRPTMSSSRMMSRDSKGL